MYGSSSSGQMSSGLLRYRSAPTSLLGQLCEDLIPGRPTSPETDSLLARFLSSDLAVVDEIQEQKNIILPPAPSSAQLPPPPPSSSSSSQQQQQQMMTYQQQQIQSQMGMDSDQIKNSCSLIRHSSSPAGLFDHNGYGSMEGYPLTSWDDLSDNNFSSSSSGFNKRQKTEPQPQSESKIGLNHQFSLPKTSSSEMAAIDKLLQFQDSVPCRIRAKRGCATHPRSIAERMRRTRISERMRKLQELVPNMDKQTNTADMLDLAVDYIKDLQKQAKTLSDNRASCTCSGSKQRP